MAGQRRGFARDAFHHVAVAADRVDVVVEQLEARPVEMRRHPLARRSPCPRWLPTPWPERAGGGLDSGGPAILRMAGTLAVELPKSLDIVERHRQLAERSRTSG